MRTDETTSHITSPQTGFCRVGLLRLTLAKPLQTAQGPTAYPLFCPKVRPNANIVNRTVRFIFFISFLSRTLTGNCGKVVIVSHRVY